MRKKISHSVVTKICSTYKKSIQNKMCWCAHLNNLVYNGMLFLTSLHAAADLLPTG